jgi:hypothetical protein
MPKQTRKQKNRDKIQIEQAIATLHQRYYQVVNDYFSFGAWIGAMIPTNEKYNDSKYDEIMRWFLVESLVFCQINMQNDEDQKIIVKLDKDKFRDFVLKTKLIDQQPYSDTFKKEDVVECLHVCLELFFNNTIAPIIDVKSADENKKDPEII